uniref:HTH psq-type domain-containing protein n=1 Tax=Haemonchus contortus TaxID=6289 RepID=A0A7I4YSY7_HAECO
MSSAVNETKMLKGQASQHKRSLAGIAIEFHKSTSIRTARRARSRKWYQAEKIVLEQNFLEAGLRSPLGPNQQTWNSVKDVLQCAIETLLRREEVRKKQGSVVLE